MGRHIDNGDFIAPSVSQGSKKPLQFYNCHDKSATELCRHDQYNFTPGDWCLLPKKVLQNILNFKSSFAIKILDKKCNIFWRKIRFLLQRKKTTKTSNIYLSILFILIETISINLNIPPKKWNENLCGVPAFVLKKRKF